MYTHRDAAARAAHGQHRKVGARAARRRIDHDPDSLVHFHRERRGVEGELDVDFAEDLLQRVEGQPRKLRLDEVRAVLHHDLRFHGQGENARLIH